MEKLKKISQELSILLEINLLLNKVKELRETISEELKARIFQKFRLDWNFHSNAIEGNTLNYGETMAFLMHGVTAKGKPLKDHLDLRGHNYAIDFLMPLIKNEEAIRERDIRELHAIVLQEPYEVDAQSPEGLPVKKRITLGQYKTMPNHVRTQTGETHYYASPEETPILMQELMENYHRALQDPTIHPLVLAAYFHHRFTAIHPFDDGNGRLARILMNLILMQAQYPPIIIRQEKDLRSQYYAALAQADAGDLAAFVEFVAEQARAGLKLYIRGAQGESIDEPDDLDKEIALFKRELEGEHNRVEAKWSPEISMKVYEQSIAPLIKELSAMMEKFNAFFLEKKQCAISFHYNYSVATYIEDSLEILFLQESRFIGHSFQFIEFSVLDSMFSLEVKLWIKLNYFDYAIYYQITPIGDISENNIIIMLPSPSLKKYYHQFLTAEEIAHFSKTLGAKILETIKSLRQNPNFLHPNIDTDSLLKLEDKFNSLNSSLSANFKFPYKIKDNILFFKGYINPSDLEILKYLEFLNTEIGKNLNWQWEKQRDELQVDDLPF